MSEVTRLLQAIGQGDQSASSQLLPLVYAELRRLARWHMSKERKNHTLEATALVHEAYLRLVADALPQWEGRGHFFTAAAEAMRRILIDHARSKNAAKRMGQHKQSQLTGEAAASSTSNEMDLVDVLALDEALTKLAVEAPEKARLVMLRYFAGLSVEEAAQAMGISERTAKRYWVTAKGWLYESLHPHS